MAYLQIIAILPLALLANWAYQIYSNYLIARKTGLRLIISPITPFELPWHISPALFGNFVKRQRWFRALDQTCAWQDKNKLHAELGPHFIHVSPGMNMLCTSDPVAIDHVFKKIKDFVKPEVFKTLDFFGPNIITVNDEPWTRHRKLTAPCFNERVSTFVWDESLRQAADMLEEWLAKPDATSNRLVEDSGTVALHVLTAAAFGEQRDFHEGVNKLTPNHELSFRDALRIVLRNPITAAVVSKMPWLRNAVLHPILSKRIQSILLALVEFKRYMLEAIARERHSTSTTAFESKRPNLLNALVKASDEAKAEGPKSSNYMSDDELTGNLFMFAFAGHETTATTISYALAHLAINPAIQDWVAEELLENIGHSESLDYTKIQPRLKRTLALMYETVRLFGVPPPWRSIALKGPQLLITGPGDLTSPATLPIPANTQVLCDVYACHTSPLAFADAEKWNPKRWIQTADRIADEQLMANNKMFFGWGWGPRICPGQKFAQVEFTAVLATILTNYKIVPAAKDHVSPDEAKAGIEKLIRGSTASMAVNFTDPDDLWVRLVPR
ncbi:cytochrome P450 [Setomelanomma holmii]|uniref:Cytochrome P450 n=1 Tax=Setomelanomma holmii TaxID=210430 RepID=A0A9P4H7B3_9PLEO|nr:cytochrome P450 [Setomelanomma holmii]